MTWLKNGQVVKVFTDNYIILKQQSCQSVEMHSINSVKIKINFRRFCIHKRYLNCQNSLQNAKKKRKQNQYRHNERNAKDRKQSTAWQRMAWRDSDATSTIKITLRSLEF